MKIRFLFGLLIISMLLSGCAAPRIKLYPSQTDPLKEFKLQGEADKKILLIPIRGHISTAPGKDFLRTRPSMVQEVVSQLNKAEKDPKVKAVLLKIDTPGGSVTASDILYNEILSFKKRTGKKVVVVMMNVAASGGYYISLPADYIIAHPTTTTGSIGVIFIRPKVHGLLDKIGVAVEVNTSGANKDMGSPFRETTKVEEKLFQDLTDQLGERFFDLVAKNRRLSPDAMTEISTAKVYLADDALKLGLIDKIGYMEDAIFQAKKEAGLPDNAKVVVYRRIEYPDDNLYNAATYEDGGQGMSLVSLNLPNSLTNLQAGFYYLWFPAVSK
jgi:protease-4